jgi:hypothetical protein
MNFPMANPGNWIYPIDVSNYPRTYSLRRFLTHGVAKNTLNPLTLCLVVVLLLFHRTDASAAQWWIAAGIYLGISAMTQAILTHRGKSTGDLEDVLAPKARLRPKLYLINSGTSLATFCLLLVMDAPDELVELCLAQITGMLLLAVPTVISLRRKKRSAFKASMHVFAATLLAASLATNYLVYADIPTMESLLLYGLFPTGLVLFISWGRVCHVPCPEHTLAEVVSGALIAVLSFVFSAVIL